MKKRSRIIVNASTVLISGGFYLTMSIIRTLSDDETIELFIICPSYKKYKLFSSEKSRIIVIPKWQLKRQFRLFLDLISLPRIIRKVNPDLVFSLTNIPARTNYLQFFLHDNPFLGQQNLTQFNLPTIHQILHRLRNRIIQNRLKYVDHLIVQSDYHKNIIQNILKNNIGIQVLPPLPPNPVMQEDNSNSMMKISKINKKIILCLSRYYAHKNLEIIIRVGRLINKLNMPYVFVITLNENQDRYTKKMIKMISQNNLNEVIINIGQIKHDSIFSVIDECDAMILPSLLESFSLVFPEAWLGEKPLFVSDNESIRDVCKNAAIYFNPHSERNILETLNKAFDDPDYIKEIIKKGKKRLKELPNRKEYIKLIHSIHESAC